MKIVISPISILLVLVLLPLESQNTAKRDLSQIFVEIEMAKARLNPSEDLSENKVKLRLNKNLDQLKLQVEHISRNRPKLANTNFATLWLKMNSVEGKSVVYPELLVQILEMPFPELLKKSIEIGLISEVPGHSNGCCAIDGYYKFNHEKVVAMPATMILITAINPSQKTHPEPNDDRQFS